MYWNASFMYCAWLTTRHCAAMTEAGGIDLAVWCMTTQFNKTPSHGTVSVRTLLKGEGIVQSLQLPSLLSLHVDTFAPSSYTIPESDPQGHTPAGPYNIRGDQTTAETRGSIEGYVHIPHHDHRLICPKYTRGRRTWNPE